MQFLHNQLLNSAATDGMSQIMKYGGIGAAVGGTYGAFSDTGTMMEGAFKGGLLGGGGAAGLKYFGNRYVSGLNVAAKGFTDEASSVIGNPSGLMAMSDAERYNTILNIKSSADELGKFNLKNFGLAREQEAAFSNNVENKASGYLKQFNQSWNSNYGNNTPYSNGMNFQQVTNNFFEANPTARDRDPFNLKSGSYSTNFYERLKP